MLLDLRSKEEISDAKPCCFDDREKRYNSNVPCGNCAKAGYIPGLTLQSYLVPMNGSDVKQVRLYMTVGTATDSTSTGVAKMIRVNVNAIDRQLLADSKAIPLADFALFTKEVMTTGPNYAFSRLAYVRGKVYYIKGMIGTTSVLASTDIKVAIPCGAAMAMVAPLFQRWPVSQAQLGKAEDATPGSARTEFLRETSPMVAGLPWEFKAYRKVVNFQDKLVTSI